MYIILTQCFPSRLGGIERLISNLALGLGKKNKVIVFADRHHYFYDSVYDNQHKEQIVIRRTGGLKFFRRKKKIQELKVFIESKQVKLVVADTWKSLELGIDYLNLNKIPTFCLAHGNELLTKKENKIKRIVNTLNKVSTIIANSNFTANLVKNIIKDNNKIKVVYPGANDLRFVKNDNFIKITGNPVLLTLGRLEKRKGHAQVLKALTKLKLKYPNTQYIIAGEGNEKSNLKQLVKKYELQDIVNFVGIVNDNQKRHLYENTSLIIMPTLDDSDNNSIEGFGIAYLEASFFGIPSIASNIGGSPEAVINEKTGIVIKNDHQLYDCIEKLLLDKEKLSKLGENAKKRAISHFKWEHVIKNYLEFIK